MDKNGKIETRGEVKKNMDTYGKKNNTWERHGKKHGKLMKHVSHIWPTTTFQSAFDPPQATRASLGKIPVDRRLRCLTFNYDDNCGLGRYRRTAVDVDDQVPFILCFFWLIN